MIKSPQNMSIWSGKPTTVSILVPARDSVVTHFAYSLSELIKTTNDAGIETYLFFDMGSILLKQRENLVEKAKEVKSEYILWLDSDMIFPPTTILRLLNHGKNFVACNYMKRSLPLKTVAYKEINNWESYLPLKPQNKLIKVEGVGLGCVLMKTQLFDDLEKPYFEFTYNKEKDEWLGEDFNLCKKLRNQKQAINIDTLLSMEIKHVGSYAFGFEEKNNIQK